MKFRDRAPALFLRAGALFPPIRYGNMRFAEAVAVTSAGMLPLRS